MHFSWPLYFLGTNVSVQKYYTWKFTRKRRGLFLNNTDLEYPVGHRQTLESKIYIHGLDDVYK